MDCANKTTTNSPEWSISQLFLEHDIRMTTTLSQTRSNARTKNGGLRYTPGKAYPSASGGPLCSGAISGSVIEQKPNISAPRGHRDRFSAFSDRVPKLLPG